MIDFDEYSYKYIPNMFKLSWFDQITHTLNQYNLTETNSGVYREFPINIHTIFNFIIYKLNC